MITICLNMIVKNESKVLPRLLATVKDYIDYYVIADTGSTDGTPELIKQIMDGYGIPGEITHHKWINFGANRQLALQDALKANRGDFLLIIDADEEFVCEDPQWKQSLTLDYTYNIDKCHGDYLRYSLAQLINVKKGAWTWYAPIHNYIVDANNTPTKSLSSVWIKYHVNEGAKSHNLTPREKYLKDAQGFLSALAQNPRNTHAQYYLAQSYRDAGEFKLAIKEFKKTFALRTEMEMRYLCAWQLTELLIITGAPLVKILGWAMIAQDVAPHRLEAIHCVMKYCRLMNKYQTGYMLGKAYLDGAHHNNLRYYYNPSVYNYAYYDELAICAYQMKDFKLAQVLSVKALECPSLPEAERTRIQDNFAYYLTGSK